MLLTDSQINLVAKSYYQDNDFGVSGTIGELPLWNLYNLFTSANKTSYIDNFLERSLNATYLTEGISNALSGNVNSLERLTQAQESYNTTIPQYTAELDIIAKVNASPN